MTSRGSLTTLHNIISILSQREGNKQEQKNLKNKTNPIWYPNKNEMVVATTTCGKESFQEGVILSGSIASCNRAKQHERSQDKNAMNH